MANSDGGRSTAAGAQGRRLNVVFLHLDLGIGGAEQLVVNAAVAAQNHGHTVTIYTTHHDPTHCFAETTGNGVLAGAVRVSGDWLPRTLLGRCTALCAAVRMVFLALVVWLQAGNMDAIVLDGVSVPVPVLLFTGAPVLFYCHFPDKLLCVDRQSLLKRLYRFPLDFIEEATTLLAHRIVVNSKFTLQTFRSAFTLYPAARELKLRLLGLGLGFKVVPPKLEVLYPPINLDSFVTRGGGGGGGDGDGDGGGGGGGAGDAPSGRKEGGCPSIGPIVSLNRFERKKNIMLAVEALAVLRDQLKLKGVIPFEDVQLVIAGGCDASVPENVDYRRELEARVSLLGLTANVRVAANVSDEERARLLRSASMVLYTPHNEHFGIVPLEAMYAGAPVICVKSGGPLETVLHGETGFLCEQTPGSFASAMLRVLEEPALTLTMGARGRQHVEDNFSLQAFGRAFNTLLVDMVDEYDSQRYTWPWKGMLMALLVTVLAVGLALGRWAPAAS